MPLHDWTNAYSGLFHDFHQSWSIRIKEALNRGLLPKGVLALVEQKSGLLEPDVLAIERHGRWRAQSDTREGSVATAEPQTRMMQRADTDEKYYAAKANRIVVRKDFGDILAVIEIVSPGNKNSKKALSQFVDKTSEFIASGVHVLVVDVFPPPSRDPQGIHKVIWEQFNEQPFDFPIGKDRILVSYRAEIDPIAYIEPIAVGDTLADMPLFLSDDFYISVPLRQTYEATWESQPQDFHELVLNGS